MEFSVVICTYNPEQELLKRVLDSVTAQQFPKENYEVILVDNNSSSPVPDFSFVKATENIICLTEKKQGLAYARIAGAKISKGNTIVFVDDDNVLNPNYLSELKIIVDAYPQVAVWGPGVIEPEYPNGAPAWIKKYFSGLFQQKNKTAVQYGCVVGWPDYYPAGSGMSVKKSVLVEYIRQFESGKLNATGRKGNSLASAEDSQIVWAAVKKGMAAGTSPALKLIHVIPSKRLTRNYLESLNFGISSSYKQALCEMFPEQRASFTKRNLLHKFNFVIKLFLKSKGNPVLFYRLYTIENAWFRGLES